MEVQLDATVGIAYVGDCIRLLTCLGQLPAGPACGAHADAPSWFLRDLHEKGEGTEVETSKI